MSKFNSFEPLIKNNYENLNEGIVAIKEDFIKEKV